MSSARRIEIAARLASESELPLDRLPYTPQFKAIHKRFVAEIGADCSEHETWWCLVGARKRGLVKAKHRRARVAG